MPAEDAEAKKYTIMNISGTKFRQMLVNGDEIPDVCHRCNG
jgi:ATP sulfurylase